jgi:hypothetical protein
MFRMVRPAAARYWERFTVGQREVSANGDRLLPGRDSHSRFVLIHVIWDSIPIPR